VRSFKFYGCRATAKMEKRKSGTFSRIVQFFKSIHNNNDASSIQPQRKFIQSKTQDVKLFSLNRLLLQNISKNNRKQIAQTYKQIIYYCLPFLISDICFIIGQYVENSGLFLPNEEEGEIFPQYYKYYSTQLGVQVYITLINDTKDAIETYWIDFDGNPVPYVQIASGKKYVQQTFTTHPWFVKNHEDGHLVLLNNEYLYLPDQEKKIVHITEIPKEEMDYRPSQVEEEEEEEEVQQPQQKKQRENKNKEDPSSVIVIEEMVADIINIHPTICHKPFNERSYMEKDCLSED